MRICLIALLLGSTALPAFALSDPKKSDKDPTDRTVTFDPHNRAPLTIRVGGIAVITFDPSETIEQVIKTSDAPFSYQCDQKTTDQPNQPCEAPYSNNLPLTGRTEGAGDLVVLTRAKQPNDTERAYPFLVKVVKGDSDDIVTHLTFTYSPQSQSPPSMPPPSSAADNTLPPHPPPKTPKQVKAEKDAAIYEATMLADPSIGSQNTHYVMKGHDRNIAPVTVTDNYRSTGFSYPGNMPQPAVFKVMDGIQGAPPICLNHAPTKAELEAPEQTVNTIVRGALLTVQETWPHWRLRSGPAVIDIWNCAYDPIGYNPGTGTDQMNVVREIIGDTRR